MRQHSDSTVFHQWFRAFLGQIQNESTKSPDFLLGIIMWGCHFFFANDLVCLRRERQQGNSIFPIQQLKTTSRIGNRTHTVDAQSAKRADKLTSSFS